MVQPPLGGAGEHERGAGRVSRPQVVAEELAHQSMQPVPAPLARKATDEEPTLLEHLEEPSAIRAAGGRIGELAVHLLEHRHVEEERAQLGRLLLEHLRGEVVDDRSIGAPEPDQRGSRPERLGATEPPARPRRASLR